MYYSNRASLLRIIGGHLVSSSSSSSSSRLLLLNGSRNIINAGSFSSSSSIRGNSHFFSRTKEEEEEEARLTRRRGYGSTIPSTRYEKRGREEGGGRRRREQLGNTSRTRFCFSTCTFLARGRGAAAAAAEQEQQREQLDDATTTVETTLKPKRKTKKQLKDDEFIANVLVPGLRRFYAEFKHLNVPKGYAFSKDGEEEEEEEEKEEEQTPRLFGRAVHNFRVRRGRASLTEAQLKALDAVGAETGERFVWDADEFVFEKQIVPGLVLFKERFGHMNVPHKYCGDGVDVESSENEALRKPYLKDFPLGAKVNDMRAKGTYILHQPQRLETLALLGFVWDDDQFRFEEMLVPAAVAYRQYCKRKLVESYSAERKRFPKKMFTWKHFKFLLPWTAVITAVEQTTTTKENNDVDDEEEGKEEKVDDKSEEQNLRDIPEFQSLLRERPYLDGYALGNVARCAHREHEKQSKTMKEVSDDDDDDDESINRSMGWLKTATVTQPPRNTQPKQERAINQTTKKKKLFIDGRAERILRMLKTLGAVFDEEKDVILTESFEERDKGGTRQRRRKKKKEIEKSLSL